MSKETLETKAKTTYYLYNFTCERMRTAEPPNLDEKWVPLEEAQKAIALFKPIEDMNKNLYAKVTRLEDENTALSKLVGRKIEEREALEAKLAEANNYLSTVILRCQCNYKVGDCEDCCDKKVCEEYALRGILADDKPQTETEAKPK